MLLGASVMVPNILLPNLFFVFDIFLMNILKCKKLATTYTLQR